MKFYDFLIEESKKERIEKTVVGAIIVDSLGRILILSRKKHDYMGVKDELPTGNLEKGENILVGLIREVKEETNLDLKDILCYVNSFDYMTVSGKNVRQYNFAISVDITDNIILNEHDCYKWQSIEDVRNNMNINDEVKNSLEIYYFNREKFDILNDTINLFSEKSKMAISV